jgi:hypothetical protein
MARLPLKKEAARMQRMLAGKIVRRVRRHRSKELLLEFKDGTRLFVDLTEGGLEFSITSGR